MWLWLLVGALSPDASAQAPPPPIFSDLPCRDPSLKPGEYVDQHLIYFAHGSAALPSGENSHVVLRSAACWIKLRAASVQIMSHSDTSGEAGANLKLSERRGRAVADALIRLGVDPSLIRVDAFGEARPAVWTRDGVPEPLNRRVLIDWTEPLSRPTVTRADG